MTLEFFEALVISLMGLSLIWLSHVLGSRGVMRFPAAVSLAFSGVLAMVWQVPRLLPVPGNLKLPFEVVEVQFFASISICLMLFAIDDLHHLGPAELVDLDRSHCPSLPHSCH